MVKLVGSVLRDPALSLVCERNAMRKRGDGKVSPPGAGADTLDYICAMLRELRVLAHGEGADMLSYLIEMAYVEASDLLRARAGGHTSGSRDTKPPE